MNELVEKLILNQHDATDVVLKRCKEHSEKTYRQAVDMLNQIKEYFINTYPEEMLERAKEVAISTFQNYYYYNKENDLINIWSTRTNSHLTTNIIKIKCNSTKLTTKQLIKEINELHDRILALRAEEV